MVDHIRIRGARVHNLKNVNVDVPLGKIVGVAGVSGSGKSSLALGVLYAEGSRRYLDALSTYTRRRMTQAAKASVDEVLYVPAALALHQRPAVPGIRSTFGTGTELLNSLRLMFSRLSSYPCPQCGHWLEPSLAVAAEKPLLCPQCGASVRALSAEEFAFNSQGACRTCSGTGMVNTVENALSKVKDEKGMKRVEKFLRQGICPDCGGTRLCNAARTPKLRGITLDKACQMTLVQLTDWVAGVPDSLPEEMRPMARNICESFQTAAARLLSLGLGYLTLDRSASTLSTGERQRMQLARAVRNRTTGVLYVLDEPSIGLHPSNIEGLTDVMHDLVADGNSVVLVDHDTQILKEADWLIEMGPEAGAKGGHVIAQGSIPEIEQNAASQIGPFLAGRAGVNARPHVPENELFAQGSIHLETSAIHTVKPLELELPKGRLTVVTGVSGSGKTTLILESLVPALQAKVNGTALPAHVKSVEAEEIAQVKLIDATPIGINVRSTVATYANVHDELRKLFAKTQDAKDHGYKAGDFSYNTGKLRCPTCDGTGVISLDVQFLPDVEVPCPDCGGSRYSREAAAVKLPTANGEPASMADLMDMDVSTALEACADCKLVRQRLQVLKELGLGYLTLGEETPSLSGGEAQRLKLASEMGKGQADSVFVFDEPTIGLHPLDVQTLLGVFQKLIGNGATVVVIEHDLDVIRNADYLVDMGPGGGDAGGRIVAAGTPEQIRQNPESITGRYI